MILYEATFYKEVESIANDIYDNYNGLMTDTQHNIDVTHYFIKYLPYDLTNKIKTKNIKIIFSFKKIDEKKQSRIIEAQPQFDNKNYPSIFIKYFAKIELSRMYLRHEIAHAIDNIRTYPKFIISDKFSKLMGVPEGGKSEFDKKAEAFTKKVSSGEYKTKQSRKIGYEKLLGDVYHTYGTENIELNQRITEFVHNMNKSSFRSRMMNNNLSNGNNKLKDYDDLLRIIFKNMYTKKMLDDEDLKKYIVKRLNRENVLQYINPEVFNRKLIAQNRKAMKNIEPEKIVNARTQIKKQNEKEYASQDHEEIKQMLDDYKYRKGIRDRQIGTKRDIELANISNKLKNNINKEKAAEEKLAHSKEVNAPKTVKNRYAKFTDTMKDVVRKSRNELRRFKKNKLSEEQTDEEVLEEGIRFFRTSKKLKRLLDAMVAKLEMIEDQEERRKVITLINKIDRLANKFEKIETDFKIEKIMKNKTPTAKKKFEELTIEFADIIKLAKKEDTKKILKKMGSYSLLFAAMVVPYEILNKINPIINPENSNVKRALAIIGMSIPIKVAQVGTNSLIDAGIKTDIIDDSHKVMANKEV